MHPDPDELEPDAESFARLVEVGSSVEPTDFERVAPPADLWDSIAARLDDAHLDDAPADAPADAPGGPAVVDPIVVDPTGGDPTGDEPPPPSEPPRRLDEHRRRRGPRTLVVAIAAAVALLVVGAAGVGLVVRAQDRTEVVASTTLDVLEGSASASAELVRSGGEDRLIVTAENMAPAPPGTHYELWLVDPGVTDPRSLGPMTGSTEVTVPSTIDPEKYPVVDISLQENGTHEHSGHSLLRGTLQ